MLDAGRGYRMDWFRRYQNIDDIEEAELYRVRYGEDIEAAQAAALEAEGKTIDDDGVPYL